MIADGLPSILWWASDYQRKLEGQFIKRGIFQKHCWQWIHARTSLFKVTVTVPIVLSKGCCQRPEEVHNADEVSLLCSLIRPSLLILSTLALHWQYHSHLQMHYSRSFSDLLTYDVEQLSLHLMRDVGFFLVLFSRFLVLKMCSRARVWAIRAELDPTQVKRHITAFRRLWNITGSNDPWHFSIQFCSLIQSCRRCPKQLS